jgi:hypothetical protein
LAVRRFTTTLKIAGSFVHLATIGELLRHFEYLKIPFELEEGVQRALAAMIGHWAVHRTKPQHPFERQFSESHRKESETLEGVALILPHIMTSDELHQKIWAKADAMDHGRVVTFMHLISTLFWPGTIRRERQNWLVACDEP